MSNPFEELDDNGKTPPPRLKNKIIGSYTLVNSIAKIVELFMGNFAYTMAEVVKLFDKQLTEDNSNTTDKKNNDN